MDDMFQQGEREGRDQSFELGSFELSTRADEYLCGYVWGYTDRMVGLVKADAFWSLLGENAREARAPIEMLLTYVPEEHTQDVRQAYVDS